jgi:trypsin
VDLPVISDADCLEVYGGAPPTFDYNVCTGDLVNGGIDACAGDAGSPLVVKDSNVQAAMASWGAGCARPGYPGVNTEVSFFLDWIRLNSGLP